MPEKIIVSQTVQIGSTLQRAVSSVLEVDAYDVIEIIIPKSSTDQEVEVQPGSAVSLLMITSDGYDPPLTYKVNDAGHTARTLNQPQLFVGSGAVALLDPSTPSSLFFSNGPARDVRVSILVGRSA